MAYLFPAHQFAVLSSDHSISSTTATEVTGLSLTLPAAGTYLFDYRLIVQTSGTTVGILFGINFTGTHTKLVSNLLFPSNSSTDATGTLSTNDPTGPLVANLVTTTAESTTAPSFNAVGAFTAADTDAMVHIFGTVVVTATGDLELWHSSDSAAETRVENGSTVVVRRLT